jgi:hypothetical protein
MTGAPKKIKVKHGMKAMKFSLEFCKNSIAAKQVNS